MDFNTALTAEAKEVVIAPSETSYFSTPNPGLDPRLFQNGRLIGAVRDGILSILFDHLRRHYYNPEAYIHAWLAGSGVSYQWAANRTPADLDCLVGVDYVAFRRSNTNYKGLSNQEIASMFNDDFRNELYPLTENYLDSFELTFYVNVASDIRTIKPYAAYSLTDDDWTVEPSEPNVRPQPDWERKVSRDESMTMDILERYSQALTTISSATTASARINAESALRLAVQQGAALFEDIHHGRGSAFSPGGQGYADYANYRWQAGKKSGAIQALKELSDISKETRKKYEAETYGMELPTANVLVRRAATYKH